MFDYRMDPIGFLMSKRKVITINDRNLVDFLEVSLPSSNLAKNGLEIMNCKVKLMNVVKY